MEPEKVAETHEKDLSGVLPNFEFRWDEKDDTLDVDATGYVSKVEVAKFEQGSTEYHGHHTKRVNTGPRVFETDIGWRGQKIYSGQIGFNLERETESGGTVRPTGTFSVGEAAKYPGIPVQYIRYLMANGIVAGKKLGRSWAVLSLDCKRKRKRKRKKTE